MYNLVFLLLFIKLQLFKLRKLIDSINSLKLYLDKNYKNKFKLELFILDNSPKEPLNRKKINLNSNLVKISYWMAKRNLGLWSST